MSTPKERYVYWWELLKDGSERFNTDETVDIMEMLILTCSNHLGHDYEVCCCVEMQEYIDNVSKRAL